MSSTIKTCPNKRILCVLLVLAKSLPTISRKQETIFTTSLPPSSYNTKILYDISFFFSTLTLQQCSPEDILIVFQI
jgi:hypothetical protein